MIITLIAKKHWDTPKLQQATLKKWDANSAEEAILRVQKFFSTDEFRNAEPYPDSQTALKKLSEKFDIIVVTARDIYLEKQTRDWILEHFQDTVKGVLLSARYNLEGKAKPKIKLLKSLHAKFLIDDNAEICIEASEEGLSALLFGDYPWNQVDSLPENVSKVKNWHEVLEYFSETS